MFSVRSPRINACRVERNEHGVLAVPTLGDAHGLFCWYCRVLRGRGIGVAIGAGGRLRSQRRRSERQVLPDAASRSRCGALHGSSFGFATWDLQDLSAARYRLFEARRDRFRADLPRRNYRRDGRGRAGPHHRMHGRLLLLSPGGDAFGQRRHRCPPPWFSAKPTSPTLTTPGSSTI